MPTPDMILTVSPKTGKIFAISAALAPTLSSTVLYADMPVAPELVAETRAANGPNILSTAGPRVVKLVVVLPNISFKSLSLFLSSSNSAGSMSAIICSFEFSHGEILS